MPVFCVFVSHPGNAKAMGETTPLFIEALDLKLANQMKPRKLGINQIRTLGN